MSLLDTTTRPRGLSPATTVPAPRRARRPAAMLPWGLAALLFLLDAVLSVQRHRLLRTSGYDLGIFEQEVRSYAGGHLPTASLKGPDYQLLGDHFSPIVASIAPLYRLFPSPVTLLLVQAALLATAVVPIAAWAEREVGRGAALVVGAAYGLSWGIAQTVGFDFHEVAFAVPLLAWSIVALGNGRLRAAVAWAAPLVLVKEDLGLTLAAIGLLVAWRGARRLGLLTALVGAAATLVETYVVIPAFNPAGNAYTGQVSGGGGLLHQATALLTPDTKMVTLALLLAPTAFVALRSPLLLIAVPTLGWRFLSDNPAYWGTDYHYSAVLMPVVFAAFVDGLRRTSRPDVRRALVVSTVVTACLLPSNPFWQLTSGGFWHRPPATTATLALLDRIPTGATVAASNWLVPQLTSRADVSLFGAASSPLSVTHARWLAVDTGEAARFPVTADQQQALLAAAARDGYVLVARAGTVTLWERVS